MPPNLTRRPHRRGRRYAAVLLAALLAMTAGAVWRLAPLSAQEPGGAVTLRAVPLNADDPAQDRVGRFRYRGGLVIASPDNPDYHDLSDFDVTTGGGFVAVGDKGQLVRGRILLDARGWLSGLADLRASRLMDLQGGPLVEKVESDAEGLALLANGDMLVSFERQHRIWRYPANGRPPTPVPSPAGDFPENSGLEALGADPGRGPEAYIAAAEMSGQTWRCDLGAGCTAGPAVAKDPEFGVVAVRPLPNGGRAWLLRTTTPFRGRTSNISILRLTDAEGRTVDEARIRPPMTVDNFEGVAVVPGPDGALRFYLLSDDNAPSRTQRTLMLAFDWQP